MTHSGQAGAIGGSLGKAAVLSASGRLAALFCTVSNGFHATGVIEAQMAFDRGAGVSLEPCG